MKTNYHAKEAVSLKAAGATDRARLHKFLCQRGYRSEDEFYFLPRKDRCEPWQGSNLLTVDVRMNGSPIYETEDDVAAGESTSWNELILSYLLAYLPPANIALFVAEVAAVSIEFDLAIWLEGRQITSGELSDRLESIAKDLSDEWDAPGSDTLAILIEEDAGRA
jgi:hypothetical protein